jgi:hypothetical protein
MGSGPSPPRSGPQSSGSPRPRPQRPARAAARSMRPAWVWDGSSDVAVARCHRAGDRLNSGSQSIVSDGPRGSLRRKQRPLSEEEKHHATGTVVRIAPRTTHPGCTPDPLVCGISYPRRKTGRVKEYGTNMGREYETLSITSTSASLTFQENGSGRRYAAMGGRCVGRCHPRRPAEVRSAQAVETSWAFAIFAHQRRCRWYRR